MTAFDLLRFRDWTDPVPPAAREVVSLPPDEERGRPPVLFVPGHRHGAAVFAEHWLPRTAGRGFPAHALTPRPGGDLRARAHDVVQTAAGLPRQTVLVGHGTGAAAVAQALGRYPARAAVLVAPVLGGWRRTVPPRPVGAPPVLVVGSPDDRVVAGKALDRAAAGYGEAPLMFPGMGHDMMLEDSWAEPIDAILDWLEKLVR
ncbi:alpha/beta hydrolase [Actinoplanes oblitus]|uniref:Alpha/beta hydrolase n=1 Tax=Actinoplanes oblitus TaxID=3040509 RepID=A0ABY8WP23_9ACTN|nr:alpha/beta hydrolase [Actinoplanes oblitus]WIM98069.1 alpha/beta hydrolase [Actinoplanes oblitus]